MIFSRGLRILIVNSDYPGFLEWHHSQDPTLARRDYEEQLRRRHDTLFGVADHYSVNLRRLGHEAWQVYANNAPLQSAWAREHDAPPAPARWRRALAPLRAVAGRFRSRHVEAARAAARRLVGADDWTYRILAAQIRHYKPDVVLNQDLWLSSAFLAEMKEGVRLLVGQIAAPIPPQLETQPYDLMISSLPNLVEHFRARGIPSELHRLGFEPTVLDKLKSTPATVPVSFVGSLSPAHQARFALLEHLCRFLPIGVWGTDPERLPPDSPIRARCRGPAWGIHMYEVLKSSRVTINQHIDVAENYANNLRLYEATGVGTLLVTDWKENLADMFVPGKEVVTYRSPEECVAQTLRYLSHEEERCAVAAAGQARTIASHSYALRMEELTQLLQRHWH